MLNIFSQYKGLRKELYILLFGRMIAAMGSLITMMITLILKNKMGFEPSEIANVLMIMGAVYIPGIYISGKLTDRVDKRKLLLVLTFIGGVCMLICCLIPLSLISIGLYIVSSLMGYMQFPVYDAIFADLSKTEDRDKVFSLNYLGANLGGMLTPTIGGLLFANHLDIAFLISAISAFVSIVLIAFFAKDLSKVEDDGILSDYQKAEETHLSELTILRERKTLILYLIGVVATSILYSQIFFLLPLNLEMLYGTGGAVYYGTLMTIGSLVVITFTPLCVKWFKNMSDVVKILVGNILITATLSCYIFIQGNIPGYYLVMVIFTFGEVFTTIGQKPYLSKRVPASHRGRITGLSIILTQAAEPLFQKLMGYLIGAIGLIGCWMFVSVIGVVVVAIFIVLSEYDKKDFANLYL